MSPWSKARSTSTGVGKSTANVASGKTHDREGRLTDRRYSQALISTTFVNDRNMLQFAFDQFNGTWAKVGQVPKLSWSLTFQPLPPSITQHAYKNGSYGNVLGLEQARPLILCLTSFSWDSADDDDLLIGTAQDFLDGIDAEAGKKQLDSRFKYLDYAWPGQKVIPGYGLENKQFMENVSSTYDPDGLFQKMLPGGFKLFGDDE